MSILIHSESDSSSSTSSLSKESDHDEPVLQEEPSEKPKIPLSASIMIENLKPQNQEQLNKAIAPKNDKVEKITIRFQPIGSTPSINPRVFRISPELTVSTLMKFIIKKLRIKSNTIYLYIQNSFQPTPDEVLGNLYDFFKTNNELIVSYCQTIAFG